jgi:cob(I)alamin adenosyltransferase
MKGCVQVYTGNGKGKTTASLGLALRAVGAGFNVFIGQFTKGSDYSELNSIQMLSDQITLKQFGQKGFIRNKPDQNDINQALAGLKQIQSIIATDQYQMVILDEVNIAIYYQLFTVDHLIDVLDLRHPSLEVILTGRYADPKIIEYADLVTEMKEIKHYFKSGIKARVGIEK